MRQNGHDVSEVVDLPLVIDTELDEIVRRREAVGLQYQELPSSTTCPPPTADTEGQDDVEGSEPIGEDLTDRERAKSDLVGLAFSGGGIRSASFNLGLFQALHRAGLIRNTDYLSTVSGGGYIGAHVASLVLGNDVKMDRNNFPLAPKERGEQPDRVIDFIRCGKYLVRQPLVFARWYFTGVALNNLVLLSGLLAIATLIAMIWRSLDTWPMYNFLRASTAGWSADWNRPFFLAVFALLVWIAVKSYQNWRSLGSRDGGMATTCLLIFYGCVAIALGVLLGNGDIGGLNWNWTGTQSRSVWVPLLSLLGICLLPLVRPWRLLHSGTRPASKAEGAIFKLTSYALLAGVPLALIAYISHEDISHFSATRTDLTERDVQDWRLLSQIQLPVETHPVGPPETFEAPAAPATPASTETPADSAAPAVASTPTTPAPAASPATIAKSTPGTGIWWDILKAVGLTVPQQQSQLASDRISLLDDYLMTTGKSTPDDAKKRLVELLGNVEAEVIPGETKPVTGAIIRTEIFGDDKVGADAFFTNIIPHLNQRVIQSDAFAGLAGANVNDAFWDKLAKKEEGWQHEVDGKTYRRDIPVDYANYQTLSDDRKDELAAWAGQAEAGRLEEADIGFFNRLYLEAAWPEFIVNRNRILRSVVAVPDQAWRFWTFCISLTVFVVGLILVDPNVTSIHRYYSRQLARAYIEPVDGMGRQIPMCRLDTVSKGAPYLLINATVNLYGRRDPKVEPRDIFVFSRKFCGSQSTRYCPSSQYLGGSFDLANAMAISGGAVTTSSVGNPLVAVMMFVLNFRLGQWLPNPREQSAFARPALWQVLVDLFRETHKHSFCFISDGGHYENLGATALLERKCKVIVLSDAGQDENHVFAEFVKLYRNLRTRRGIQFFDLQTGKPIELEALMLHDPPSETEYRGKLTKRHFVSMGIRYEDGSVGLLLYVKPSFTGDEEVDLQSYRASNVEFPHQPTSDQMYDEIQFESYRQLGFHIGSELCGESEAMWDVPAEDRVGMLAAVLADTDWKQIERASMLVGGNVSSTTKPLSDVPGGDLATLLHQYRNGEPELRVLALKEIASLDEGADAALPELIGDLRQAESTIPDATVRAQLACAIGSFGPAARPAARHLVALLRDPHPDVRAASAEALGEIGVTTQTALKALEKAARDEAESVRAAAEQSLQAIGKPSSSRAN